MTKRTWTSAVRAATLATALLLAGTAQAALQDVGPINPANAFPRFYRDLNGVAVEPCLAQTPSQDPAAGGAPMCFPLTPEAGGWPGNFGMEVFYSNITAIVDGDPNRGIKLKYVAALEASYATTTVPATLTSGQEMVFSRIRVIIGTDTPGLYIVTHPYGVESFTVEAADLVGAGAVQGVPRAVFYTRDIGLTPGVFTTALGGDMGPFPMWDTGPITMSNGEVYLGDPNIPHTITGTPFGGMLRVDGPPGSRLDGTNDFLQTPLFTVLGKKYTTPIPQALKVTRATYTRNDTATSLDVYADSVATANLVLTGTNVPTATMTRSGTHFYAHTSVPGNVDPAFEVMVSNVSDVPVHFVTAPVTDDVIIESASYDIATQSLVVIASSSDTNSARPPALVAAWPGFLGAMTRQVDATTGAVTYTITATPVVVPPHEISVSSSAGGRAVSAPSVASGAPTLGFPTASNLLATTDLNIPITVAAAITNSTGVVASVLVVAPPAHGTVTISGANLTYTPAANYAGTDVFQYVAGDTNGVLSSVGAVNVTINMVPQPPVANPDDFAVVNNGSPGACHYQDLLANDTILAPSTINRASIVIQTQPTGGTVTVNPVGYPAGVIRYCASRTGSNYTDGFTYTVANNETGARSAPGTVFIDVRTGPESLSFSKVLWTASQQRWTIVGSSNVFSAQLHPTVKLYLNTVSATTFLGTVAIDAFGKFQFSTVGTVAGPVGTSYTVWAVSSNVPDPWHVVLTGTGVKSQAGTFK